MVQEDPAAEHGRVAGALLRDANATSTATARLRFTELVLPGGEGAHFNGGATPGALALSDCELTGGRLDFNLPGTWTRTVALTNTVFDRVTFSLGTGSDPTLSVPARNNLFRGCPAVNLNAAPGTTWEGFDHRFDTTPLGQYFGGVANGYNAYPNCPRPLTPAGSGNLTLTALSYPTDARGRRGYAPATPPSGERAPCAARSGRGRNPIPGHWRAGRDRRRRHGPDLERIRGSPPPREPVSSLAIQGQRAHPPSRRAGSPALRPARSPSPPASTIRHRASGIRHPGKRRETAALHNALRSAARPAVAPAFGVRQTAGPSNLWQRGALPSN